MKLHIALVAALPLLMSQSAAAQDLLGPLQDFVTDLTAPPPVSKPAPRASVEAPPPVPRPRPPTLPDVPVVEEPVAPAPEVEEETPSTPAAGMAEDVPAPEEAPEPAEVKDERVYQGACPAVIRGLVEAEMTPPLSEGVCGERSPLTVTAVLVRGRMVPLSSPVVTNCQMAGALPGWLDTVDGYAEAMLESPLAQVQTGTSYMCRAVVGGDSGRLSEHGFANAVDVVGFTLENGRSVAVEGDWMPATQPEGRLLRLAHDAACSGFTTVLGPEANAEHEDHLHLDLGCHGQTCTARICE